jgi:hypothetical protein
MMEMQRMSGIELQIANATAFLEAVERYLASFGVELFS